MQKALLAIVIWVFVIRKIHMVRHWREWTAFSTWLFSLLFAIAATLRIMPIRIAFDAFVGVPNLAWFVEYVFFCAAMYIVTSGCYAMMRSKKPRWFKISSVVAASTLAIIYLVRIVNTPPYPDHTVPRDIPDVLFMDVFYVYLTLTLGIVVYTATHIYRNEEIPCSRFRWQLLATACWAGIIFCGARGLFVTLACFSPNLPGLNIVGSLETISLAVSILLWPMYAVSGRIYSAWRSAATFAERANTLYDLNLLCKRIKRFYPRLKLSTPNYWRCLLNLDFRIYQTVISILDGHLSLKRYCYLSPDEDDTLPPPAWHYDSQLNTEVRHLVQLLGEAVHDTAYESMIKSLRNTGKTLRTST